MIIDQSVGSRVYVCVCVCVCARQIGILCQRTKGSCVRAIIDVSSAPGAPTHSQEVSTIPDGLLVSSTSLRINGPRLPFPSTTMCVQPKAFSRCAEMSLAVRSTLVNLWSREG